MSTYSQFNQAPFGRITLQQEVNLYGSSRLGVTNKNTLTQTGLLGLVLSAPATTSVSMTKVNYELSNHLGNVLTTFTGRKLPSYIEVDPQSGQTETPIFSHYMSEIT